MKEMWIIICYTSDGDISVVKMFGTKEEVQEKVMKYIQDDKELDEDCWYSGTESVYDFDASNHNGFNGYNNFEDYSVNYVAYPYNDIQDAPNEWR